MNINPSNSLNPRAVKAGKLETINNNQATYNRYFYWLCDLALSLFEWENMPEGTNSRFLEMKLLLNGSCCFFYDDEGERYLNLPFNTRGELDVYGEPSKITAYSHNYTNTDLDSSNSVIIYNNSIKMNDIQTVEFYAYKLYNLSRTIDINLNTQKLPYFISAPESQRNTINNLMKKVGENELMIIANDKFDEFNKLNILPINPPYNTDKLREEYKEIMSEVCEYFGINASSDKKERMVVSELMVGIGMTEANRQIRLKTRKDACEKINKMFGLNVDVKFRKDVDMLEQMIYNDIFASSGYEETNIRIREGG